MDRLTQLTPEERMTLETYNSAAEQWSNMRVAHGLWEEELKIFKELLPSGKILEIGSGSGIDAKALIALGYEYIGTDISAGLLNVAKKENPGVSFLNQSVYDLNFLEGTQFDGFWASAVLLHIPKSKIDMALQRIRKFVRVEGAGFITLKRGEGERLEDLVYENSKHKRLFSYYSEEEFKSILQRNNFEVVRAYTKSRPPSDTAWLCFFVRVL